MRDIRVFVCCHKPSPVPESPLLRPLQLGAALAGEGFPGFLRDDAGENISAKNRSYCELTGQYWAWKNVEADYIGFFHYRRYLEPRPEARRPYRFARRPTRALLDRLGFGGFPALIEKSDLVLPRPEDMFLSVREHYAAAPHHRGEDLRLMEAILRERQPDYAAAAERYLSGSEQLFGNIFIMRLEIFRAYCAWLFPLLEEFDRRADWQGRTAQEQRADGYLAERLLGVYVTKHAPELRVQYLPRLHFDGIDARPDWKRRAAYALLPPSSRRRAAVKRLLGRGTTTPKGTSL